MESSEGMHELLAHLARATGLGQREIARILDEVTTFFGESVEEFVTRRHRELQAEQLRNEVIFEQIGHELRCRRFAAPTLTARQIRRLVYG